MATLNAKSKISLDGSFTGSGGLNNPSVPMVYNAIQDWGNGTGDNQANQYWNESRTASAETVTYELDSGMTDDFGTALVFTKIKALFVQNTTTTAAFLLTIAGDFMTGAVGGAQQVDPGGIYFISSPITGYTVTGAATDTLTVASGANIVTYKIYLIGTV